MGETRLYKAGIGEGSPRASTMLMMSSDSKTIVPVKLRLQVRKTIPAAHQGASGVISWVENKVFWP